MDALLRDKDEEIANLLSDNRILNSKLNQCKSDREFVWSLWLQLQEQHPDVTKAVGCVMEREKAVNEEKDRKTMEIINSKDCEIRRLKNEIQLLKSSKRELSTNNHNLNRSFPKQMTENGSLHLSEPSSTKICDSVRNMLNPEQKNSNFLTRMATLESKLSETTVDLKKFEAVNCNMESQIRMLQIEKSKRVEQLQSISCERDLLRRDNEKLKTELFRLETIRQELECELAEKKHCANKTKERLEHVQAELHKQNDHLCKLEKAKHEAERCARENEERHIHVASDLRRKVDSTRRDSIALKQDLEHRHRELFDVQTHAHDERKRLENERDELRRDNENLRIEVFRLETLHQEFACELDDKKQCTHQLKERLEHVQTELHQQNELLCQLEKAKHDAERCARENEERHMHVASDLRRKYDSTRRNSIALKQDLDLNQRHVEEKQREIAELQAHVHDERSRLENEVGSLRSKIHETETKAQQSLCEIEDQLKCKIRQLEQEFQDKLESREREFQRELKNREECYRRELCAQEDRLREEFHREINCEREKLQRDTEEKECRHKKLLEDKRAQFSKRLCTQEREFSVQIETAEEEYRRKQSCVEQDLHRKLQCKEEESRRQLERQKEHFEHQIQEEKDASDEKISILERRYSTQVKFLEEQADQLEQDCQERLNAQERRFEKAFQEQEDKYLCEKTELERELRRARNGLAEVEGKDKCCGSSPRGRSCSLKKPRKESFSPPSPPHQHRPRSASFHHSPPRRSFSSPHHHSSPLHRSSPCSPSPLSCPPLHPRRTSSPLDFETSSLDRFTHRASTPRSTPPKKRGRKKSRRSVSRSNGSSSLTLNRPARSMSQMCRFYAPTHSPNKEISTLRKRVNTLETKIDCMKIVLQLKQEEMDNLSCAHDRRMKRLQNLQADFKKMIQSCGPGHTCEKQSRKNNNRCLNDVDARCEPPPDSIYNELACLKQKNKLLRQEKMALEDEIDRMQVQRASDKSTIQQLLLGFNPGTKKHCKTKGGRARSRTGKKVSNNSLCWIPNPSCGYQQQRPTVPYNRNMSRKLKSLQLQLDNSMRDISFLQNEKMELQTETGLMRDEIKSLRRDVIDARSKETRLRDECEKLRDDMSRCEYEKEELKKENETLQQDVEHARDDNINKRWEIGNLRSDAIKLRGEIKELKKEMTKYSNNKHDNNKNNNNRVIIMRKKPRYLANKRSKSARQHQKFLNKSVLKMKRMFGDNFNADQQYDSLTTTTTTQQNDTTTTTQQKSSDASSLGQAIVCSSRHQAHSFTQNSRSPTRGVAWRQATRLQPVNDDVTLAGDESEYVDDDGTDDVITSDRATSRSIRTKRSSSSAAIGAKKTSATNNNPGMVAALRHRLAAIQKQYSNLKSVKISTQDKVTEEKAKNEELTKEVENYQSKLKSCKQNLSRLHREIEILKKSKQELEDKYEEEKMSKSQRYSDADYKYIEAKLKTANHDNVKISTELQQQRDETDKKANQISIDNDRISRLERDVAMKRQLIDDLRVKVKNHDEKLEKEQEKTKEATSRLRTLEAEMSHKKSNVEALRRQVQVATKERHDYESMLRQCKTEMNRQGEQMEKLRAGKAEAEAGGDKLAEEARLQLTTLASRSEEALDKLNSKLERSERRLREFVTMTTVLSARLAEHASSLRNAIYDVRVQALKEKSKSGADRRRRKGGEKLSSNAQRIACQILDISSNDFRDLMAPVHHDDSADEELLEKKLRARIEAQEGDRAWKEEVDKMTNKNTSPPFAKLLVRLLWQKMDECLQMAQEQSELTAASSDDSNRSK